MKHPKKQPLQRASAKNVGEHAEHTYFVLVHYPKEFRRALLEASRSTIYSLQRYQRVKLLREQKKHEVLHLRSQMKELSFLVVKLTEQLPPDLIPPQVIERPSLRPTPANKQVVQKIVPQRQPTHADELDTLSEHLSSIEERLRQL